MTTVHTSVWFVLFAHVRRHHNYNVENVGNNKYRHTLEQASIEHGLYCAGGGAVKGRLMKAGRQAFRDKSVCYTVW